VAVLIERQRRPNAWEDWRFRILDVVPDPEAGPDPLGPACLQDDGQVARFLHRGLRVALHRDEGEGYHLNLTSDAPVCFVMWRVAQDDPSQAAPELVTLSYNEAGRWMDAQERVDAVPLPAPLQAWLAAFTAEHYKPEPKQRKRPASFQSPGRR
jgi:hypothetical protein